MPELVEELVPRTLVVAEALVEAADGFVEIRFRRHALQLLRRDTGQTGM